MDMIDESFTTILIVADSNFRNLCQDPQGYISSLKERLGKLRPENFNLLTVSGRYGLGLVDATIETIEVNDRNKTQFSQTLENSSLMFDEVMVISISDKDQYIAATLEVATSLNKSYTNYKYPRRL